MILSKEIFRVLQRGKQEELVSMGYRLSFQERTSGPVNAIGFDRIHGTCWGGSSNHGEDYGIGW
jgi:gamma-glutamyltranspeptidase/glutathione hydrolase